LVSLLRPDPSKENVKIDEDDEGAKKFYQFIHGKRFIKNIVN